MAYRKRFKRRRFRGKRRFTKRAGRSRTYGRRKRVRGYSLSRGGIRL